MTMSWEDGVRDPSRIAALERSGLLGTGAEDAFDRLTELAAELVGAPRACMTLVDAEQYTFKSAVGIAEGAAVPGLVEESFCRYVVGFGRPLVVDDTRSDPRTCDHPAIELLGIAAWAGYPIEDPDGAILGSFCVIDTSPHAWLDRDIRVVATLSRAASAEIALSNARRALVATQEEVGEIRLSVERERAALIARIEGLLTSPEQVTRLANELLGELTDPDRHRP
jgi:GAF domain-containing protein